MKGTLELNGHLPAKLIVGDKELDVNIVSQSYKEDEHREGITNRLTGITEEITFTCVCRKYRDCK